MNEDRIQKTVMNLKLIVKCSRELPLQRLQKGVRKDVTHKEGKTQEKIKQEFWENRWRWTERPGCYATYKWWNQ